MEDEGSPSAGKKRAVPEPMTNYKSPPKQKLDYGDGIRNHISSGRKGEDQLASYGHKLTIKAEAATIEEGEAMAMKIEPDLLPGDTIEYLAAKPEEGKAGCLYGRFWTQLGLETMKRSASANLGEKLAPTGGYWEVKERVWILTVNDGVQIKGPTRYADKFLAYIASQVPDMVGSFKDANQAYLFDVPDRDLDLTVWTVQSVKTLARQMGVRVIDKSGYRKSTNPYAYMYTNIDACCPSRGTLHIHTIPWPIPTLHRLDK